MVDIPQQELNFGESESYNWEDRVYRLKNTDPVLARNPDGTNATANLATQQLVNRTRNLHKRVSDIERQGWVTEPRLADGAVARRKVMAGARAIGATPPINSPFNTPLGRDYGNESNVYGNPFDLQTPDPVTPFVRVYRDLSNRVFLEGFIAFVNSPTGLLFVLPEGFRPRFLTVFTVSGMAGGSGTIRIRLNGQVFLTTISGGNFSATVPNVFPLNSICFMADDQTSEFSDNQLPQ